MSVNSETGLHPSLEFSSRSVLSFALLSQVLTSYLAPRVVPVRKFASLRQRMGGIYNVNLGYFFFLPQELYFKLTKCQLEIEGVKGKIKFFRDVLKLEKMNK